MFMIPCIEIEYDKLHENKEVTNLYNNHLNAKLIKIVYYTFFMKLNFSQINLFNKMTLQ